MTLKQLKSMASILISLALCVSSGCRIATSQEIQFNEIYYNEQGLSSFKEGFYSLLPTGEKEEAALHFEDAVASFKCKQGFNSPQFSKFFL